MLEPGTHWERRRAQRCSRLVSSRGPVGPRNGVEQAVRSTGAQIRLERPHSCYTRKIGLSGRKFSGRSRRSEPTAVTRACENCQSPFVPTMQTGPHRVSNRSPTLSCRCSRQGVGAFCNEAFRPRLHSTGRGSEEKLLYAWIRTSQAGLDIAPAGPWGTASSSVGPCNRRQGGPGTAGEMCRPAQPELGVCRGFRTLIRRHAGADATVSLSK